MAEPERALHVFLPAELHKWVRLRAAERGITLKEVVIEALEQYQRETESKRNK